MPSWNTARRPRVCSPCQVRCRRIRETCVSSRAALCQPYTHYLERNSPCEAWQQESRSGQLQGRWKKLDVDFMNTFSTGKTRSYYEHITKCQADRPFAAGTQRTAHVHCPLSSSKCSFPHLWPIAWNWRAHMKRARFFIAANYRFLHTWAASGGFLQPVCEKPPRMDLSHAQTCNCLSRYMRRAQFLASVAFGGHNITDAQHNHRLALKAGPHDAILRLLEGIFHA